MVLDAVRDVALVAPVVACVVVQSAARLCGDDFGAVWFVASCGLPWLFRRPRPAAEIK